MSKPNILFISCFRQYDGWGLAAKDYCRALSTVANVTVRNIFLSNQREKRLPPDIETLENTSYEKYDFVIQKCLPNLYYYDGRFKQNIGMMVFETELHNNSWFNNMNIMDKILVPSKQEKKWLDMKIKAPVYNVSQPLDVSVATQRYQSLNDMMRDNKIFKFLFIGEAIQRKGIKELLQAYFAEFTVNDNTLLVIKTNANLTNEINQIRSSMRRFSYDTKYPQVFLISERISENDINSLHQDSHVFIMPSYGEAFNRPAAKSLLFNKPVIATVRTGMFDYLNDDIAYPISSYTEQVFCETPPIPTLYTSDEYHKIPSILSIRSCMRNAFDNKDLYMHKVENIKKADIAAKFSYESVGHNILRAIECQE